MKPQKILRSAWEGLMLNKVRSFLTTLGVIIGVASVIVMLAVSAGTEAAIADQINALGANLIIVSPARGIPGAARTMLIDDAYAIADQVVGLDSFSAEQTPPPLTVKANGTSLDSIAVIGTTADFPSVRDYAVASGRYFDASEDERKAKVIVLGAGIAADLFGADDPLGQTVTVGSTKLTVVGVMEAKGMVADLRAQFWEDVFVPGNTADFNQSLENAGRVADFLEFGELMIDDALARKESCGCHFNTAFQTEDNEALRDDENFCHVAAWEFGGEGSPPIFHKESLFFENVALTQRSYK